MIPKYELNQEEICTAVAEYVTRHHGKEGEYTAMVTLGYTDKLDRMDNKIGVEYHSTVELLSPKQGKDK